MRLSDIRGLMTGSETRRLRDLAKGCPAEARIVEIGTHTGLSTCWLADGARRGHGAHVVAIDPYPAARPGSRDDPFELGQEGPREEMLRNVGGLRLWQFVTPLRTTSLEAAATWQAPIGLLFVDAIHEYAALEADYRAWAGFIVAGGWLALHDFNELGYPEVPQVVREIILPSGEWTDVELTDSLWTARRA